MTIIGIDLAWGDKKPDGICLIQSNRIRSYIRGFAYPHGDDELVRYLQPVIKKSSDVFITVDAPIICPNINGTRPVDRLTHTMFHREHAACHPANLTKCPRPPRILQRLEMLGCRRGWDLQPGTKTVSEVYPHPAMVRLFKLERIVKYKKGRVGEKKKEFKRLQQLMRKCMKEEFPFLEMDGETTVLLKTAWSKAVEDKTDALFCALIGLWHWYHRGTRSEAIGDLNTGFILLPEDLRKK